MNIFGHHIVILNDAQHALLKTALADTEHSAVTYVESEAAKLWGEFKAAVPTVVTDFKATIADLKSSTLSGGDKAVKVATDFLATASAAVQAIPGIKDLLVHGATEVFADTESEVVTLGAQAIADLTAPAAA